MSRWKQKIGTWMLVGGVALSGCAEAADDEPTDDLGFRGMLGYNGLDVQNGLTLINGLALINGLNLPNGLTANNGLSLINGLALVNGLPPTSGYMASDAGRKLVKYLVECALPTGDSLVKNGYTFNGKVGLAPEWKYGSCDKNCQEWVSACLLARTNEFGVNVQIDMRAAHAAIGTSPGSAAFSEQEGAFFGNLFANPPVAWACMGTNWGNAQQVKRDCTTGSPGCFIKNVNYLSCMWECTSTPGGTMLSCPTGNALQANRRTYDAVITTYLKPWWEY